MTKLFIIGNGFDLAHGMKTRYLDFKNYLIKKYGINDNLIDGIWADIPESYQLPDGGEEYDNQVAGAAIIRILDNTEGEQWKDVETSLGVLDYSEFLDNYDMNSKNDDDNFDNNDNDFDELYRNEDNAKNLCGALQLVYGYFQDWVKTVKISKKIIPNFQDLISPENDLFLNFNYTRTLEKLYNAQNVCHIHGTQDDEIFFGHGNDEDRTEYFQNNWIGAEWELNKLQLALRKDTNKAYNKNAHFFKEIEKTANKGNLEIYSFGFSFSEVDMIYLKEIFRRINTNDVIFHLNDFEKKEQQDEYINILKDCGFEGNIHRSFK